jgi:hypothetical protein
MIPRAEQLPTREDEMKQKLLTFLAASSFLLVTMSAATAQHATMSDKELMGHLQGAAPAEVLKDATILNMTADGQRKPIQTGTNGWTCMYSAGVPMCADGGAMEWAKARKAKGPEPQKLGFIYMLKGDMGVSNTDPHAEKETPDNNWITTGPHVMIVGAAAKPMMQGYPRDAKADPKTAYVMWPDTPFEHLMFPSE